MKLEVYRSDLKSEFQKDGSHPCVTVGDVEFEKFTKPVQAGIQAIGIATFYAPDRKTARAISPPK